MSSFTSESFGIHQDVNEYAIKGIIPFPYGIGIEVELEFNGNKPHAIAGPDSLIYWDIKRDGSLKNGVEFVVKTPLFSSSIVRALAELNATLIKQNTKPILSERTSVHIHIDARDMSKEQISNFILLYLVFERVLFKYCGEDRADNVFCLSAMKSDALINTLALFFNADNSLAADLSSSYERYASLNLASLARFGSIEIRSHKGSHNAKQIISWINILLSLKRYVMHNNSLWGDLPSYISHEGPLEFMHAVFGTYSRYLTYDGCDNDIIEGVRVSQNVLYSDNFKRIEDKISSEYTGENSDIFLMYMERKYPDLYKEMTEKQDYKTVIKGKEDTYDVDVARLSVITEKGKSYNLREDKSGWYFINVAKTKIYLSDHMQKVISSSINGDHLNAALQALRGNLGTAIVPEIFDYRPAEEVIG